MISIRSETLKQTLRLTDAKKGVRVIYTDNFYGDSPSNPLWGGSQGWIAGTISGAVGSHVQVDWDNGLNNDYYTDHLCLFDSPEGNCEEIW